MTLYDAVLLRSLRERLKEMIQTGNSLDVMIDLETEKWNAMRLKFLCQLRTDHRFLCLQEPNGSLGGPDSRHEDIGVAQIPTHPYIGDTDSLRHLRRNEHRLGSDDRTNDACKLGGTMCHGKSIQHAISGIRWIVQGTADTAYCIQVDHKKIPMPHSIVFLGTSAFAVPCLQALASDPDFSISLVITQTDKPVGRKQIVTASPVKVAALELGLLVLQPPKLNDAWATIKNTYVIPEFLIAVSYGQILSEAVLQWPSQAAINVHASLLPELRGASPIQHAILEGKRETGVTVQQMVKELDAGPILSRRTVSIDSRETYVTLHEKLAKLGAALLCDTLHHPLTPREQDHGKATFCKKLKKEDGVIDPSDRTAEEIDRRVRALSPWPSVVWNGKKILETSLESVPNAFPLPCKNQTILYISSIQPSGKKPMNGAEYARGYAIPSAKTNHA